MILYQLIVGDFHKPLSTDWGDSISDPLLREDLKRCFAGDPHARFASVVLLTENLRGLPERRAELGRQKAEQAARERAAYRRGIVRTAALAALIVAVVTSMALVAWRQSDLAEQQTRLFKEEAIKADKVSRFARHQLIRAEEEHKRAEHNLYIANMNLAGQAWEQNNVGRVRQLLEETAGYPGRGFEWYYWQRQTHLELRTLRGHSSRIESVAFSPDGQRIVTGSGDMTAKVWEAATPEQVAAWENEERSAVK